jgi:hypothetical protein
LWSHGYAARFVYDVMRITPQGRWIRRRRSAGPFSPQTPDSHQWGFLESWWGILTKEAAN